MRLQLRRQRAMRAWSPESSTPGTRAPAELLGPRVLRRLQQPAGERLALRRALAPEHARQQPRHRVGDHQRRQLAAGQRRSRRSRSSRRRARLADALVHALVPPGQEDQVRHRRQLGRDLLREASGPAGPSASTRAPGVRSASTAANEGLRLQHHPAAAAELIVVGDAVPALRVVSEIDHPDVNEPTRPRAARASTPRRPAPTIAREERHDVDAHQRHPYRSSSPSGGRITTRRASHVDLDARSRPPPG